MKSSNKTFSSSFNFMKMALPNIFHSFDLPTDVCSVCTLVMKSSMYDEIIDMFTQLKAIMKGILYFVSIFFFISFIILIIIA